MKPIQAQWAHWDMLTVNDSVFWAMKDIHFFNNDTGIIVCTIDDGHPSAFFKTFDGGINWTKTIVPTKINDMEFISEDTGYAVGILGRVYRTINAGDSWQLLNTLSPWWSLLCITFKNNHESFIGSSEDFCTCDAALIHSNDGWLTYNGVPFDTNLIFNPLGPVNYIKFSDELRGFVGRGSGLLKTIDGGLTWFQDTLFIPYTAGVTNISLNKFDSSIWVCTEGNVQQTNYGAAFYKSINNGINWQEISPPILFHGVDSIRAVYDMEFITEDIVYAVGGAKPWTLVPDGGITYSIDGGDTWLDDYVGGNDGIAFLGMDCPTPQVCYTGGGNLSPTNKVILLKNTQADFGTSIKSISVNHNSQLVLYPNPVTSNATIEYNATNTGKANLTIENYLGQIIQTFQLNNNQKQTINMSNYPNGIYFIKCFDGKELNVLKLIKQ